MCIGGGSAPTAPPPPPPPPDAPTLQDATIKGASATDALRAKAAGGVSSTILTSPLGLSSPSSDGRKTLLGG